MNDVYILATGPSMSSSVAESVRGKGVVLAVSDAWRLAIWADGLVSTDLAWWEYHKDAVKAFEGKRFCAQWNGDCFKPTNAITNENSTCLAIKCALEFYKPSRIFLLGVDFGGTHFFGPHPEPLKNTKPETWGVFQRQFDSALLRCKQAGVELLNATPGSALKNIPMVTL